MLDSSPRKASQVEGQYSMCSATRPVHFQDNYRAMKGRFVEVSVTTFLGDDCMKCKRWTDGDRLRNAESYSKAHSWEKITRTMSDNEVIKPFVILLHLVLFACRADLIYS